MRDARKLFIINALEKLINRRGKDMSLSFMSQEKKSGRDCGVVNYSLAVNVFLYIKSIISYKNIITEKLIE